MLKNDFISKLILLLVFVQLLSGGSWAQLTVNNGVPYNTAANLVTNVLLGSGVTTSSVNFSGDFAHQIAYFNGATSNIGLNDGVVLSTGDVLDLPPGAFNFNMVAPSLSDPDLLTVANSVPPMIGQTFVVNGTFDAAILEFDFVPTGDSLNFDYVFASNEYTTFINSTYNDVFAFFLSGPGITGPYASPVGFPGGAINIASVPGSVPPLPITISSVQNTVMPFQYPQYYIDNMANTTVQMNGFTTVFTAKALVQCGETYHIKLAIADGSDTGLQSAVFLDARSFSSNSLAISSSSSYPALGGDTVLYEGCGSMSLDYVRTGSISGTDTLFMNVGGTSLNGIDYSFVTDTIIFQAGQDSAVSLFSALDDGIVEGIETLILQFINNGCGSQDTTELILYISDPLPVESFALTDTIDCFVDSVHIGVEVTNGVPGFVYQWNNGNTIDSMWVTPVQNTLYIVTITDTCGMNSTIDTAIVIVIEENITTYTQDTSVACAGDTIEIGVVVSGGYPPYTLLWDNGSTTDSIEIFINQTTTFNVTVMDQCQFVQMVDDVTVFQTPYPPVEALVSRDSIWVLCPDELVGVQAQGQGGSGDYIVSWDEWQTFTDSIVISPDTTTQYVFWVADICAADTASTTFDVIVPNFDLYQLTYVADSFICPGDQTDIFVYATGGAGDYAYQWNEFYGDSSAITVSPRATKTYSIVVTDSCGTKRPLDVTIQMIVPEAAFSFEYQTDYSILFENESSDDAIVFQWDFGNQDGSNQEDAVYTYADQGNHYVTLLVRNQHGCEDQATQEVVPPLNLWAPSAFTPNNDGINDVFMAEGMGLRKYKLTIYDRWGSIVFQSTDLYEPWDGGKSSTGVYVYQVTGEGYDLEPIKIIGTVSLIK